MLQTHICTNNYPHSASDIITEAEAYCSAQGLRLTDQRRQILVLLANSAKPLGAYDLLEKIQQASSKRQAPVAVYRALDFLLEAGFIHRLESRNTFLICPHRHARGEAIIFLICATCGKVDEAASNTVENGLDELAKQRVFVLQSKVIELSGVCQNCSEKI